MAGLLTTTPEIDGDNFAFMIVGVELRSWQRT